MSGVDWAALAAMQAAGLSQADVEALAAQKDHAALPQNSTANTIGQDALGLVNSNYPTLAWMLNIPELSSVIISAAQTSMSTTDVEAKIEATQWWQSQSTQAKSFFSEQMSGNEADAQNLLNQQQAAMAQTFEQLGLNPTQSQLQNFAWESLVNGWTAAQALQAVGRAIQVGPDGSFHLAAYYKNAQGQEIDAVTGQPYTGQVDTLQFATNSAGQTVVTGIGNGQGPGQPSDASTPENQYGQLQALQQNLTSLAKQYLVNMSPDNISQWVTGAVTAGETAQQAQQAFQSYLQNTAIAQYPWMQQGIQAGQTPLSLVSPYSNMVSTELGVSANNIDWTQPKWNKLLSTPDPKTGTPMQNPVWQATQQLRSDPQYAWSKTPGAVQAAYSFVQGMQETMGQRAYAGATPGEIATPASFGSSGG